MIRYDKHHHGTQLPIVTHTTYPYTFRHLSTPTHDPISILSFHAHNSRAIQGNSFPGGCKMGPYHTSDLKSSSNLWGSSSHNEQGLKSNFQEILQEEQRLDPSWLYTEELWLDMCKVFVNYFNGRASEIYPSSG